jgi:threonine/homoserine/homoserine lactone efflux protein
VQQISPKRRIQVNLNANRSSIAKILRVACAAYLLKIAYVLWRDSGAQAANTTKPQDAAGLFKSIFLVTLLNPKGLVAGLALIPAALPKAATTATTLVLVSLFVFISGIVTAVYTSLGGIIYASGGSSKIKLFLSRASAVVIVIFAVIIFLGAFKTG